MIPKSGGKDQKMKRRLNFKAGWLRGGLILVGVVGSLIACQETTEPIRNAEVEIIDFCEESLRQLGAEILGLHARAGFLAVSRK